MRHVTTALLMVGTTGCAWGSIMTVAAGPSFGQFSGVGLAVEVAALAHIPPPEAPKPEAPDPNAASMPIEPRKEARYSSNLLGIALTAGALGGWQGGAAGWNAAALAGFDYLPFLGQGAHVNMGSLAGYGVRESQSGFILMPRLGFAVTPWSWGPARAGLGLRLECHVAFPSAAGLQSCGPSLVVTRIQLGR